MELTFRQNGEKKQFWERDSRILLAISGGVDSMVLLDLMGKLQHEVGFYLGVAHIDHQLREASKEEARYIETYCRQRQLPYFSTRWESIPVSGMEEAARNFRYGFFQQVMQENYFDTLMTAHHSDDQLETMLMKMIRDGRLESGAGMRERRAFAGGKLVRPLLAFNKEALYTYADEQELTYFEDESNQVLDVQRNRIRHEVVPLLKRENPQILEHFQQLSQQMLAASDLIQRQQERWFQKNVKTGESVWGFLVDALLELCEEQRYFALQYFFQAFRREKAVPVKEEQLQKILALLESRKAQWQLSLAEGWMVSKEYELLKLQPDTTPEGLQEHRLALGESIFLSENEWLGLLPADQLANIPEKVKDWSEIRQALPLDYPLEVTVRKRKSGDRIQLTPALRKKISRVFIDKKVPNEFRMKSWLVESPENNILAVLPVAFSYLSIASETDKIHYILLYKYR